MEMKQPLSFEEQLNHLIDDKLLRIRNRKNAIKILRCENYYRLSGYWKFFLDENDKFDKNMCFEHIYDIYKFDRFLRSQIIEIITDVEIYFKTQLAYFLGIKYGPLSYMNIGNFRLGVEKDHTSFLNSVEDFKAKNKNNPIIKHHNLNYSGDIPIWALVELLSFGSVSKLYTMLTTKDKKAFVRDAYANIGHNQLDSAIHAITALPNSP